MSEAAAIWTDYAGVITEPTERTVARFCDRKGIEPVDLHDAMAGVGLAHGLGAMEVLDTGVLSHEKWAEAMQLQLQRQLGLAVDFSDFPEVWFAEREINHGWLRMLGDLRERGHLVGLMSNMVEAWDPFRRLLVPDELFDATLLSYAVGARKPEPGIFALAERHPARRHVLIDDVAVNCDGARAVGWSAVLFEDEAQAIAELEEVLR